jgi:hypothetical protein
MTSLFVDYAIQTDWHRTLAKAGRIHKRIPTKDGPTSEHDTDCRLTEKPHLSFFLLRILKELAALLTASEPDW